MGAVANLAPDLFRAIVAEVPFVDCLTTILDESLPLTVLEWEEWGNPVEDPEVYAVMKSYSPYDNVRSVDGQGRPLRYPDILATAGLSDPESGSGNRPSGRQSFGPPTRTTACCSKTELGAATEGLGEVRRLAGRGLCLRFRPRRSGQRGLIGRRADRPALRTEWRRYGLVVVVLEAPGVNVASKGTFSGLGSTTGNGVQGHGRTGSTQLEADAAARLKRLALPGLLLIGPGLSPGRVSPPHPRREGETAPVTRLRLGVIGAGSWAVAAHLPALASRKEDIEFVGVCRRGGDALGRIKERFGFPGARARTTGTCSTRASTSW